MFTGQLLVNSVKGKVLKKVGEEFCPQAAGDVPGRILK